MPYVTKVTVSDELRTLQNPEELFKMFFGGGGQNMGGFYEDPVTAGKVGHDLQAELQ